MKDFLKIVMEAVLPAVTAVLVGVLSYMGSRLKKQLERRDAERLKRDTAAACVQAVEQLYPTLHGKEKYDIARANIRQILSERGVALSDIEAQMLIESNVKKQNDAFFWKEMDRIKRLAEECEGGEEV